MSALDDNVVRFIKNKFAEIEGKKPEAPVEKAFLKRWRNPLCGSRGSEAQEA